MDAKACTLHRELVYFNPTIDRALKLTLPVLAVVIYIIYWYLVLPYEQFLMLGGLMLAYFVPPAGKESIIPIGIEVGVPWWLISSSVALLDTATALFVVWNFDLVCRIPVLGAWIEHTTIKGHEYLEHHKWIERLSIVGLAMFVMIPLQGSGGIGGAIIGKIIGMSKVEIVSAVAIGAFGGSALIGLGMNSLHEWLMFDFHTLIIGIIVAAVVIVSGSYLYRFWKSRKHKK